MGGVGPSSPPGGCNAGNSNLAQVSHTGRAAPETTGAGEDAPGAHQSLVPTSIFGCARLWCWCYLPPPAASQWATLEWEAERVRGLSEGWRAWFTIKILIRHQDGLLQRRHTRLRHHLQPRCCCLACHRLQHRQLADYPCQETGTDHPDRATFSKNLLNPQTQCVFD